MSCGIMGITHDMHDLPDVPDAVFYHPIRLWTADSVHELLTVSPHSEAIVVVAFRDRGCHNGAWAVDRQALGYLICI